MTGKTRKDKEWVYLTEDEVWKFVTKAIGRVMYNVIETYEDHQEEWISTKWLRDYTDDIVETFPRIRPDDFKKDTKGINTQGDME